VAEKKLRSFCSLFTPRAEVVASFEATPAALDGDVNTESLVCLIHRHPATAEQLAAISGADASAIQAALAPLIEEGRLQIDTRNGEPYYK
jgi:hypothetical protein